MPMTTEAAPSITYTPPSVEGDDAPFVAQPSSIEDMGIDLSMLTDLMLKTIHFSGRPSARQLADQMALSFSITDELLAFLRQDQAIEIVGSAGAGVGEQAYQYALTERGQRKADEALKRSQYVGAAPVPFDLYLDVINRQSVNNIRIERDTFLDGLSHLVLSRRVVAALGPAVNSGRSVLIYGASGNGKTSLATAIGKMMPGEVLIPYAVEVHGQIVKVFDPRLHQKAVQEPADDRRQEPRATTVGLERRRDRRWALTKRPVVSIGGELTLEDLELRYSPLSQFYIAPLQWKANSGLLIIDDFGRQLIRPQELLNRWIVPMEQGIDHLSLHTGDTLELPFDAVLVFSSNIPPGRLGDEAFFRRIRHKVEVPNPTREEYLEILRRVCVEKNVPYSDEGASYLLSTFYDTVGRDLKACHPRDVVELVTDMSTFYGEQPQLTSEWLDLACPSYFVKIDDDDLA